MRIRTATEADIPAIVAMGARFYETTSYRQFADYDPGTVAALARQLIDTGVCLIATGHGGSVVGMVGLFVAPFMFNGERRAAYEVMWWVEPEEQGAGAGKALLAAVEPACRAAGCDAVQMVHLATSPPQAAALYERMGFAHSESSYTKVL